MHCPGPSSPAPLGAGAARGARLGYPRGVGWTFFWLMVVLKVPIAMLLYLVYWAVKQTDAGELPSGGDGGVKPPHRPRLPRHPRRRGPHGAPSAVPARPRSRTPAVTVRARARHHP